MLIRVFSVSVTDFASCLSPTGLQTEGEALVVRASEQHCRTEGREFGGAETGTGWPQQQGDGPAQRQACAQGGAEGTGTVT